uniref:COG1361 S-layer family protein n=1 Tax=Vaginimicrobium propionicum TaxID=1871034 RepID=UPI0009714164|nr:CARDB domain-containing protein [Vaginimicrobium propionicum]
MKFIRSLTSVFLVMMLALIASLPARAEDPSQNPGATPTQELADIALGDSKIPAGKTGEQVSVKFNLINRGNGAADQVIVTPKPSAAPDHFPFKIERTSYAVDLGRLEAGESKEVDLGKLTLREGLETGYYALPMSVQYSENSVRQVSEKTIYINVEGVAKPKPEAPKPLTQTAPPNIQVVVPDTGGAGGGGWTGGSEVPGDAGAGGGARSGFTPRVMLTSFTTNPQEVSAGQSFQLSLTLSNMSSRTSVGNVKVTIASADASLLPVNGASSVYVDAIPAGGSAGASLDFRALPNLEERPYQMSVNIEYEDSSSFQALTSEESIAVVVRQKPRATTSEIQAAPDEIEVGQQASISFTIQNQGKAPLYNTRVKVKDGSRVSGPESFVGNIEPGANGNADLLVTAEKVGKGDITLQISYEDAGGVVSVMERAVPLATTEAVDTPGDEGDGQTDGTSVLPWLIPLLLLILVAAIVAASVLVRRRKQQKQEQLDKQLSEMDAEPFFDNNPSEVK